MVEPTDGQMQTFANLDQTQPIAMINLLKFREDAVYADGRYPNRAAFLKMLAMPDYQAASEHREAGLARTALISCPGDTIPA